MSEKGKQEEAPAKKEEEKKVDDAEKEKDTADAVATTTTEQKLQDAIQTLKKSHGLEQAWRARRAIRSIGTLRKAFATPEESYILRRAISKYTSESTATYLLSLLPQSVEPMETGDDDTAAAAANSKTDAAEDEEEQPSEEVDVFLHLMVVLVQLDTKDLEGAAASSASLLEKVSSFSNQSLSLLACKAYFYFARTAELGGNLSSARPTLLAAFRTASLQRDSEAAFMLLNLLLRNYLHYSLYDQAEKLNSQSQHIVQTIEEGKVSNNQVTRYLFYIGRMKATQLKYSDAVEYLSEALRKAPQKTARGFRLLTTKLLTIVQLLVGEIPERSVFRSKEMVAQLKPYFRLTKAVRVGDLGGYNRTVKTFSDQFKADNTYPLIVRLRHNVIKTGLRKINVSYSQISFVDVKEKLNLESAEEAEYIVAKAIKDRVMEAQIDHAGGFVRSSVQPNVYTSYEPQAQFGKRIEFCLKMHNKAVKAMRFPADAIPKVVLHSKEEEDKRKEENQKK